MEWNFKSRGPSVWIKVQNHELTQCVRTVGRATLLDVKGERWWQAGQPVRLWDRGPLHLKKDGRLVTWHHPLVLLHPCFWTIATHSENSPSQDRARLGLAAWKWSGRISHQLLQWEDERRSPLFSLILLCYLFPSLKALLFFLNKVFVLIIWEFNIMHFYYIHPNSVPWLLSDLLLSPHPFPP